MNKIIKQSLVKLQTDDTIDADLLAQYCEGKLSKPQRNNVENLLTYSPTGREELYYVRSILASNKFNQKAPSSFLLINWWSKIPAMVFVLMLSLIFGILYQSQDQMSYLGLTDTQFSHLSHSLQKSVKSLENNTYPARLFNNVQATQEIVRSLNEKTITPLFPLWSKVKSLDNIQWQATENQYFTLLLIDNNDELIQQFNSAEIKNIGKNYFATLKGINLCSNCQYAWRVMNNNSFEATEFIPFEFAPLSSTQINDVSTLPEGIAKLSFYWNNGYLHDAKDEIKHITDNKNSSILKEKFAIALAKQMRQQ